MAETEPGQAGTLGEAGVEDRVDLGPRWVWATGSVAWLVVTAGACIWHLKSRDVPGDILPQSASALAVAGMLLLGYSTLRWVYTSFVESDRKRKRGLTEREIDLERRAREEQGGGR